MDAKNGFEIHRFKAVLLYPKETGTREISCFSSFTHV